MFCSSMIFPIYQIILYISHQFFILEDAAAIIHPVYRLTQPYSLKEPTQLFLPLMVLPTLLHPGNYPAAVTKTWHLNGILLARELCLARLVWDVYMEMLRRQAMHRLKLEIWESTEYLGRLKPQVRQRSQGGSMVQEDLRTNVQNFH